MENLLISIVIPVFNREKLIVDTMESILLQTHRNWELWVVDDGSTDNTISVVQEYEQKDNRIKIIYRNRLPKGPSTCRNIGAKMALGEFLVFWDSDDIMAPWCLEERVNFLIEHNLDFAFFQMIEFGNKGNSLQLRLNLSNSSSDVDKFINFNHGGGTPTVAWRKESFTKTGGWNEELILWEDAEIHVRAIFKGLMYSHSEILDGFIRNGNHLGRLTSDENAKEKIISALAFFESISPFLSGNQLNQLKLKVASKIWARSYFLKRKEIKLIANLGLKKGFLSEKSYNEYLNYFFLFSFVKKVPLIRRPFYYLIEKRTDDAFKFPPLELSSFARNGLKERIEGLNENIKSSFFSLFLFDLKSDIFN